MKLGLGTVQLGLPYGVANKKGKPDREAAMEILKTACQNGMDSFDTAAGYGESEAIIGEFTDNLEAVISRVRAQLPDTFPTQITESILNGLRAKARSFARSPTE